MTDRYRACCTCFQGWLPMSSTERKCPACGPGRAAPNATKPKRITPKAKRLAGETFQPLDLSTLPQPSDADLAAYLAGLDDQ